MNHNHATSKTYQVSIGHCEVIVQTTSAEEAVRIAKQKLALELPRLYDVIATMDRSRFKVLQAA